MDSLHVSLQRSAFVFEVWAVRAQFQAFKRRESASTCSKASLGFSSARVRASWTYDHDHCVAMATCTTQRIKTESNCAGHMEKSPCKSQGVTLCLEQLPGSSVFLVTDCTGRALSDDVIIQWAIASIHPEERMDSSVHWNQHETWQSWRLKYLKYEYDWICKESIC